MAAKKRITSAELRSFDILLWTYVSRMGDEAPDFGQPQSLLLECESKFGVGHLEERKLILRDTLNACKPDINAVYEALRWARGFCDYVEMRERRLNKIHEQYRELLLVRKQLKKWLKRAMPLGRDFNSVVDRTEWLNEAYEQLVRNYNPKDPNKSEQLWNIIENLPSQLKIKALLLDHLMNYPLPSEDEKEDVAKSLWQPFRRNVEPTYKPAENFRRRSAGRRPKPWLKRIHAELRAAGVTNIEDRRQLLMAVGLLPYHS